ncbi:hypothetical protein ADK67_28515 [Saccharothrix sp. NRRL B-16348]|uniref:hypothetical protein n=1 Tax=Saccharothrix sp. NRRL B-16348 TaxID=1415542 RepID=UPI0006B00492|nr:hypothetical protein [Saccharothrix sp. NRRL B-16348]KOX20984.1 hypothetical protein ADK67_28515 [Saccharothrix sp. NRRL B-16348]
MADLLDDLTELRRRAREDRHAYPFPLLFFGVASFLAVPLYAPGSASHGFDVRYPVALGLYWSVVLVVGGLATVWWYRRRGARVGIETSTRGYLGALAIGLGGPVVGLALDHLPFRFYSGTGAGLILLAAATVLWRRRAPRAVTLTTAVLGTAVLQHDQPAIGPFIAIGLGLVVLAALEGSTRFTTITAGYLVALCVSAAFTPLEAVTPGTWSLGSVVVLPGSVLVVGGLRGLRRG